MADKVALAYKTSGIESGGTNALTGLRTGGTLITSDGGILRWVTDTAE